MMIHEDDVIKSIMDKYDIPFRLNILQDVKFILENYEVKDIEFFDKIVIYLKERAKRDICGRYPNDPLFNRDTVTDWIFYLQVYASYLKKVLVCCTWWDRKKYMFPDDVYDIVYNFNKEELAFKYLKANYDLGD